MKTIEMCAGAGGQALGLHQAGAEHLALIEIDHHAAETLRFNNDNLNLGWGDIIEGDLKKFAKDEAKRYRNEVDLVAGGVPCPPFSKAGKQLGGKDERDLFPTALTIVRATQPTAVLLENVPGLMESKFEDYRLSVSRKLSRMGYESEWRLLQASDYGVPQLRPRAILVAIKRPYFSHFKWPEPNEAPAPTVGEALYDLMSSGGWEEAKAWAASADKIAPTLVGGSKKHGGPDLGPTRAKRQWHGLGVNAHRLGSETEIPGPSFKGIRLRNGKIRPGFESMPLLTTRMAARLQGFPDYWEFIGSKTHAYRQVGNAFPPPVAEAVGNSISKVIDIVHGDCIGAVV